MNSPVLAVSLGMALLEIRYPAIDPVALPLPGPVDVRWYGLMYLVGFTISYFILRWLGREKFFQLHPDKVGDLITALVLGVILGARIGYILFYDFGSFAANPARIFRIWEGGLSFHGGLIGVMVVAWWFGTRHGVTYRNLLDSMALCIPFGILLVRVANFINGELYGRIASPDVPWAMRFPTDPVALRLLNAEGLPMRARELRIQEAFETSQWTAVMEQVPLRHPSQLYEAFAEGLVIAIILWGLFFWLRRGGRVLPQGTFGGLFLIMYGVFRAFVELYRQPDPQFRTPDDPLGTVLGPLTMGQTLSLLTAAVGVLILVWSWRLAASKTPPPARGTRKR